MFTLTKETRPARKTARASLIRRLVQALELRRQYRRLDALRRDPRLARDIGLPPLSREDRQSAGLLW